MQCAQEPCKRGVVSVDDSSSFFAVDIGSSFGTSGVAIFTVVSLLEFQKQCSAFIHSLYWESCVTYNYIHECHNDIPEFIET